MKKKRLTGLIITVCSVATFQANANEQYDDFGFVGIGGTYGQSVFSDDSKASLNVEPNIFYNGEYGFVDGGLVNVSVLPYIGISGQWRFSEVSDDLLSLPNGINNRDGNGELGITLGTVGARLTYLHDVTDEHNGYEIQLHLGQAYDTFIEDFTLAPYVEIDYRDKRLSQHLYGISTTEATHSGLNAFDAESSFVYQTGLIGIYSITSDWLALGKIELEHHDSDSALVQRDIGWNVSLGITYTFLN